MKALNEKSIAKLKDEGRYRDKDLSACIFRLAKTETSLGCFGSN